MHYLDEMDEIAQRKAGQTSVPEFIPSYLEEMDKIAASKQPIVDELENPEEYTYTERGLQALRGAGKTYGSLADVASRGISAGMELTKGLGKKLLAERPEELVQKERGIAEAQELFAHPTYGETIPRAVEKLAGRELEPKEGDIIGKILTTAGELGAPLPIPGGALLKPGLKGLAIKAGREVATAGGAAAALHLTPELAEEGTVGRVGEDIVKIMLGGHLGSKLGTKASKIAKDVGNLASQGRYKDILMKPVEAITEIPIKGAAKIASLKATPNVETLNLAKKHGVEVPFNVGMGSTPLNFMKNNFLKSMFVSDAYKKVLRDADTSMINKVKESIDTLGTSTLKPNEASAEYRHFLKEDEKRLMKESNIIYDEAQKSLNPTDVVLPKNTINSIDSMKELLMRDIQSPATKRIAGVIGNIAQSWGILPSSKSLKELEDNPKLIEGVLSAFKKQQQPISLERLNGVRKELYNIIDYDPGVRGVEAYLSKLTRDITKDIESSSNQEFVSKWKEANKFYRNNIASRFRTDLSRSIMTGEIPIEAFNKMNSVENIKTLEKIAGESPKGKEIFDALKKAKVKEIIEKTAQHGLEEGSLRTAAFANLFEKGEKGQEILKELLGSTEYNKLADIAHIAREFSKSGSELLNTSGTALASADIGRIDKMVSLILGTVFGAGIGAATGPGALIGAATGIGTPYLLSRLIVNPKFVNQARAYAIARQQGKDKYATTLLNNLIKIAKAEAPHIAKYEANQIAEEE
jgi:hypothetical protein